MKILLVIILAISSANSLRSNYSRIIGGQFAKVGEFPFIVALMTGDHQFCGGSIIHPIWVVTAAHCLEKLYPENMHVLAGSNNFLSGGTIYKVLTFYYHSDFGAISGATYNDIALIKLTKTISFNEKVKQIALNTRPVPDNAPMIIAGWGVVNFEQQLKSSVLKFLNVKSINKSSCQRRLANIHYSHICIFAGDGSGPCSADSGGPLIYNGKLAGVTAWGTYCASGYPDVYTDVSLFVEWITFLINNK